MKTDSLLPNQDEHTVALLKGLAARHIWWKTPDEALNYPARIVAQTMDRGNLAEIAILTDALGEEYLKDVLVRAEAGQFSPRSWHYWHYRLGLAADRPIPPEPVRVIP